MKRCEHCGKNMANKRATARTCSPACRKALSRAKAAKPDAEPVAPPPAEAGPPNDDTPERGRLEASVRAKFEALVGADYEVDPLAVHILSMARLLDLPASMAPGSLAGIGKAFREAYKEFLREHEQADPEEDPVAAAQAAAAAKLLLLQGGAA